MISNTPLETVNTNVSQEVEKTNTQETLPLKENPPVVIIETVQNKQPITKEDITINTNKSPVNTYQHQIHNNPASIFTIERENDNILNKLLEDKKPETPDIKVQPVETKSFYEEVLNHFMRDIQVSQPSNYTIKGTSKQTSTKHTISQQHQVNYNQNQTQNQQTNTSSNKNYPQKSDNRFNIPQQQQPQDYMNFQQQSQFMHPYQQMMYMMMNPYMVFIV